MLRDSAKRFDTVMLWFSRTISMLVVMAGPALLGHIADRQLGSSPWITTAGIIVGMGMFVYLLTLYTSRFADNKEIEQPPDEDQPQ